MILCCSCTHAKCVQLQDLNTCGQRQPAADVGAAASAPPARHDKLQTKCKSSFVQVRKPTKGSTTHPLVVPVVGMSAVADVPVVPVADGASVVGACVDADPADAEVAAEAGAAVGEDVAAVVCCCGGVASSEDNTGASPGVAAGKGTATYR